MGKQHWKTIQKRLENPVWLASDDGSSLIVSGKYKKVAAYHLIKAFLADGYGEHEREYALLKHPAQLKVATLRRPNREDGYEDMDANFYADVIERENANPWEAWFYKIEL